eukprot:1749650-Alexandrium_andersonii.AAC.1
MLTAVLAGLGVTGNSKPFPAWLSWWRHCGPCSQLPAGYCDANSHISECRAHVARVAHRLRSNPSARVVPRALCWRRQPDR